MTDIEFWLLIIAIFILIIISAFFSSSETALTAASDARMHQLSKKGDKRASIVKDLRSNRDLLISTLLIGNNAVNVLASALATGTAITLFGEGGVAFAAIVMTLILVIFAEVLPKTYAFKNSDKFSLRVALPVKLTVRILKPISQLIGFTVSLVFKQQKDTTSNMEEELRGLIKLHSSGGDNSDRERGAMLSSVLDLKIITVEEIMKHRSDVVMIDYKMDYSSILKQVRESSYTRHPVFSGKVENIIGVLHVKDILKKFSDDNSYNGPSDIGNIISQVYFVPETTSLYDQLQAFRKRREHFAVVVDEYGDFRGIITLEDILEEIVGEIDDEYDNTLPGLSSQKDGSWIVKGDITIRDLNRTFDIDLPDEEASTIAGLVMYESRSIPSPGQEFRFHNLRIRILNKEQNSAATWEGGHVLILAGAGCGKTKTIIARAQFLIEYITTAERVQILTFTRKSASEIVERVKNKLGDKANNLKASTFHTWCMSLIRKSPDLFGCRGFSVIDRDDQLTLLRLTRSSSDKAKNPLIPRPSDLCDIYSYGRNVGCSLRQAIELKAPESIDEFDEIAKIIRSYEDKKEARKYLDYDDILDVVATQFNNYPKILDWVSSNFTDLLNKNASYTLSELKKSGVEISAGAERFVSDNGDTLPEYSFFYRSNRRYMVVIGFIDNSRWNMGT